MIRQLRRSIRTDKLFTYTTLLRSKSSSSDFRQRHPCPFITKKPGMKPGFFFINCRWSEAVNHRHAIDAGLRIRDTANRAILVFVADVVGLRYQRIAALVVKTERQFVEIGRAWIRARVLQ